jgi:hypothetical protein
MKNLDLLPIPEEKKKRLATFARAYRQNARIFMDVISFDKNQVIVRVEQKDDIESISSEWINRRMKNLGLKGKHISNRIGIDKSTISSILTGEKELTKWHKAAFYYFFKYFEAAQF